ncbi:m7GpppX diphosphatase-like isoform X2 [Anopheles stephensi]|uniref:m7GpppX diphosphatase-like isoform X2 n=1 Tax=Anopheles stephensi TaxID=30069 RepID=UPI00165887F9|nr:m7GpppX diphosphatase-like isoform X2 [Anopheles stephensi]
MLKTSTATNDNGTNKVSECNVVDESPSQRQREGQQPPAPVPPTEQSTADEICYDLAQFRTVRVLNNNSTHKCVALLGHFGNLSPDKQAIVVLEKRAFTETEITTACTPTQREKIAHSESEPERANVGEKAVPAGSERTFFTSSSRLHKEFVNDVYGNFLCTVDPELNRLKVSIIYPASEKHIVKHTAQHRYMVDETAERYRNITLPHLDQEQLSLEWLYNVLEHRKEKERILYEDPCDENGFILLPDLKWDGKTVEQLYLLCLVRRRDIRSLRDLTPAHLPLLRNVQARGTSAIEERYGIGASQLRIYLHYQPTFYHLHMHFTYLQYDPPGTGCEKAHLLSTVINNIELVGDYYQRATLSYTLKETDKLYAKFLAAAVEEPAAKRVKTDLDPSQ